MSEINNFDTEEENNKSDIVSQKRLSHFLDIEYLSKPLILDILDLAESFAGVSGLSLIHI